SATLKELISQTMVRWSQEDQIQDPELVRIMYTLLRRQYDSIGELLQALRKAYTISAASVKDTINLLAALGQIRSLLSVRMGKEEELLMINGLGYGISMILLQKVLVNPCMLGTESALLPCWPHSFAAQHTAACWSARGHCSQHSQVSFFRAALNPLCTQPGFVPGISLTRLQDLTFELVEPHAPGTGPLLKPVKVLCHRTSVVTYLAGCGLQSCPVLLAKGYPDIGWNPIEGERYLSFLRFAVFVNSEYCSLAAKSHPKLPCN
ncbi:RYR3 protein, partial [Tricholaema leucomelas]|nr:RYR3 protein [Tricholaema leucomelas]